MARRLPKLPGFTNRFKKVYETVNVGRLDGFDNGTKVNAELLAAEGLIKKADVPVKILGDGELKKKLNVKAAAFTGTAKEKIESAGGQAEVV